MRIGIILYDLESEFDFGQYKGLKLKDVFDKTPEYLSWCFQKVEWFCITDEIFNRLPIIIALRKRNELENVVAQKDWLKILTDLHNLKKEQTKTSIKFKEQIKSYSNIDYHQQPEYNWLREVSGTDDPEVMNDVYWNLD